MKMRKVLCFIISVIVLCSAFSAGCKKAEPDWSGVFDFVLEVEEGRDVRILQLTDIQIIDSAQMRRPDRLNPSSIERWAPDKMEERAFRFMREAVEKTDPDLIVLSGDNVYGEFDDAGTSVQALVAEMESYKIPWTITYGNHDNETLKGIEWTSAQYSEAEHCLFMRGDVENIAGNGNFNIGILQGGKLTEIVWLMDSHGHTNPDSAQNIFGGSSLKENQIEWFRAENEEIKEINGGESPKSIGFFHHPMRAIGNALQVYGYVSRTHEFLNLAGEFEDFKPFEIPANNDGDSGAMHEDPHAYIDVDYTFHNLLKEYNCEGWFFGHVHTCNASAVYENVRYTFGLKASQYDAYQKGEVGGTQILVGENGLKVEHCYTQLPD